MEAIPKDSSPFWLNKILFVSLSITKAAFASTVIGSTAAEAAGANKTLLATIAVERAPTVHFFK